jgi:hypothetical protein
MGIKKPTREQMLRMGKVKRIDPNVWSGRAVQEVSSILADAVLHQCIRLPIGAFELRAIMDISAPAI